MRKFVITTEYMGDLIRQGKDFRTAISFFPIPYGAGRVLKVKTVKAK